jgi:dolichol-phosphate mannosyltransferase
MPQLTVVTPTFCEADNVPILFERLKAALAGLDWELVVADDDSPDRTADIVRALAQDDSRIRVLQRLHRRGLAGAVIEGMLASSAPILAVIDADLQHDESVLPGMVRELLEDEKLELVVGSRYIMGGGVGAMRTDRRLMSKFATGIGNLVSRTRINDPMSGFFAIRRSTFMSVARNLSDEGFKILLDIMASSHRPLAVGEVAYQFRARIFGESKLDSSVLWQYAELVLDKWVGRFVPVRMLKFGLVGLSGLIVHMTTLYSGFKLAGLSFMASQITAASLAMTWNYFFNNLFTFKDKRHTGWGLARGLVSFYLVCGVGLFANVGVASYVFRRNQVWWLAGACGIVVGMVWNYAVSARITWGERK